MNRTSKEPTDAVTKITQLHLEGNIIPRSWYQHITWQNGKADLAAITILSDIVYWYRATAINDEDTGRFLRWEKKFRGDQLQRSYQQLADMFGLTKEQVRDACHRLRDAGLITLELRTVQVGNGIVCNNVVFVEPVASKIKDITYRPESGYLSTSKDIGIAPEVETLSTSKDIGIAPEVETNTKTTTETTTETRDISNNKAAKKDFSHLVVSEKDTEKDTAWKLWTDTHPMGLNRQDAEEFDQLCNEFPPRWVGESIRRANAAKTTPYISWRFVDAILKRWQRLGGDAPWERDRPVVKVNGKPVTGVVIGGRNGTYV